MMTSAEKDHRDLINKQQKQKEDKELEVYRVFPGIPQMDGVVFGSHLNNRCDEYGKICEMIS
jgi:hypothetical protein